MPPCSPDLNPIEKMWSKIKTTIGQLGERTLRGLTEAIAFSFARTGIDERRNYFRSCGYATGFAKNALVFRTRHQRFVEWICVEFDRFNVESR